MSQETVIISRFLDTYLPKFAAIQLKRNATREKGFLRPISQKITLAKEKGEEDRKSETKEKKEMRKK